jgi:hypothetical protein
MIVLGLDQHRFISDSSRFFTQEGIIGGKAREYQDDREWIILRGILARWDGVMWTGLVWLRIGTGGVLLRIRY